jgi:hypothetical protein
MTTFADLPPETANKRVLGTRKAAEFVGLSERAWRRLRIAGETPSPVILNTNKFGYQIADLIAWIEAQKRQAA